VNPDRQPVSASELLGHLPNFNHTGPIFRELVGDPDRPDLEPISNINDFNKGSIYNSVEWHLRFKELASRSATLTEAESLFLKKWAEFLGVERPPGMSDEEFRGYIVGYVLQGHTTLPMMAGVVQEIEGVWVMHPSQMGFAADYSPSDVGINSPVHPGTVASSIITFPRFGVYIITDDFAKLTPAVIEKIDRMIVAGSQVYIGVVDP
jgi:hypothetical protein